ncbi:hypothetical protein N0V95_007467, partial [Ascochyta clinopodiicola]
RFLVRKVPRAVLFYLLKDAIYAYTAASPHGSWVDIVAVKPQAGYASYPFWHRFWFSWMQILLTYVSLELVVWHQQCRRVCSSPAIFVVRDVLHLRKGSFASKYLQLFIGFGVSGLVHGGASMLYHGSFEDDGAMKVFLGQAVIIFFEDHLIAFGKRLGFKDSLFWRLVGFVWTILAVGASMESWTGSLLNYGLWVHERELDWFGIGPKV